MSDLGLSVSSAIVDASAELASGTQQKMGTVLAAWTRTAGGAVSVATDGDPANVVTYAQMVASSLAVLATGDRVLMQWRDGSAVVVGQVSASQSGWHAMSYGAGWGPSGTAPPPQYEIVNGLVRLSGIATRTSGTGLTVCVCPFLPPRVMVWPCAIGNGFAQVTVDPSTGNVNIAVIPSQVAPTVDNASGGYVYLDPIIFPLA